MMNRRGFLKAIGAVALVGAHARAAFALPARLPEYTDYSPAGLRRAVEALFSDAFAAVTEDAGDYSFGLAQVKQEGARLPYDPSGLEVVTLALGYHHEADPNRMRRLHIALYRSMYTTFVRIATRPENAGAILYWRLVPVEETEIGSPGEERKTVLRCRVGLLQTGWRKRLGIKALVA